MTHRFACTLIFFAISLSATAQSAIKTFTKSFNTDNKGTIILDLPGTIDLKEWDTPTIRFEISVNLPSGNGSMLNELANIGRYNLSAKSEGDALMITAPNLQKQLRMKGEELKETLTFVVWVPKNLKVELPNASTLADKQK